MLVDEENDAGSPFTISAHNGAAVSNLMDMYQGIDQYIKMTTLPFDDIHHIDMHMKLLDEERLIVGDAHAVAVELPPCRAGGAIFNSSINMCNFML